MHAESIMRKFRILSFIIPAFAIAGCGQGDGPESIENTAATPLPPIPPGFCDAINFEILCPPANFTSFASAVTTVIDNPDASGINTSDKVAQFQKFPNPTEFFGGTRFDLPEILDFADGQAFTVKVWSTRSVPLTFKLEETTDGTLGVEQIALHSGSGGWEELCYDFSGATLDVIAYTLIFDNGVQGFADVDPDNWTFFYDDLTQTDSCPGDIDVALPVDFEAPGFNYSFNNFEGGVSVVVPNPDQTGINTSAQVTRMQKFAATSGFTFGGTSLALDVPSNVVAGSSFTMKVWSQRQVPVLLQPEPQGPGTGTEVIHTGTGWEELTFSLPALAGQVDGITVIFDINVLGDADNNVADWTFYYDDITLVPPGGGGPGGGEPTVAAPTPTQDAADVISLFSDAYTDVAVDTFLAGFSSATLEDVQVAGDAVKKYSSLDFAGIEFLGPNAIDASGMTHVHFDIWTDDATDFSFKFVDFGGDGFGNGNDTENVPVAFNAGSTPPLTQGQWVGIDVALADLQAAGLTNLNDLNQLIIVGQPSGASTVFIDNLYFYNDTGGGGGNEPTMAAPTPTQDAADVISLFSDAYTDVAVDTFLAGFSAAMLEDVMVAGDNVKKYSALDFAGIEFLGGNAIDASGMTHVHIDVWTPDATDFSFKFVDFGGDGFGGGNDTENVPVAFNSMSTPPLNQGQWVSIDVSLADLQAAGLTNLNDLNQLIIVGQPSGASTVFIDNLYFYNDTGGGGGNEPTMAAPTPTQDAGDVISLFSDAYTDVAVDTYLAGFSAATLEDVMVAGDNVKKYSALDFAGIEFLGANAIDASGMTHVHFDIWTPDATDFSFKFVDFGGDGFGGGNDTENVPVAFNAGSTPPLTQGNWISIDVSIADLQAAGLTNVNDLNQLIIVGQPSGASTVFVDNVYFYNDAGGGGGNEPAVAAPTPMQDPGDVISLFSNAYGDVTVDTFLAGFSAAMLEDVVIDGNDTKKYSVLDFAGIEFLGANAIDASGMTHVHFDVWTPDATDFSFKFVDFGGDGFGGGNDTENVPVAFNAGSTPALTQGAWVSIDVAIADLQAAGLTNINDLNQLIIVGQPSGAATVFIDNIYFYNDMPGGGATAPATAPSAPTEDAGDVMSLFSDSYTDAAVTWPTTWSVPNDTTSDVMVDGQLVKEHLNVSFIGVEFPTMDVSGMTHLHVDVWTPDADSLIIKLVDFGGDGFGGGNDTEGVLTFNDSSMPALTQGTWVEMDIPLADFQANGLGSLTDINQLVFDPAPDGTALYLDNVYFYAATPATEPAAAAPTPPARDPADVISLFSDAYTNATVDTFLAGFSAAMLEDVMVAGDNVKKYSVLDFAGIEFLGANAIDASGMTHVHVDVWTPDATDFSFKFVDFGGDGFGGGNDTENVPVAFNAGSTPVLNQGQWVSIDVALADLQAAGLTNLNDLNQLIIVGQPAGASTVFIDNLYLYNDAGGSGGGTQSVFASGGSDSLAPPGGIQNFGSGAQIVEINNDPDYGRVLSVTSGDAYDPGNTQNGFAAFTGYTAGFAAPFGNLDFKVKGNASNLNNFEVKFFGPDDSRQYDLTNSPFSTDLGNGWWQVSIPLSEFNSNQIDGYDGFLMGPFGNQMNTQFSFSLTDIEFSGTPGAGCPIDPNNLAFNGDFECGLTGWSEDKANGTIVASMDGSGGGLAANLTVSIPGGVFLKQTGLGAGVLVPNQAFTIQFDWKGSDAAGGVIDFQVFSEQVGVGVTKADLVQGGGGFPANWTTVGPLNFTTGPDVSAGLTLQIGAICGGAQGCLADLLIDNIIVIAN